MFLQTFCLIAALLAAQVETTYTVEYGGKKYEFHISDSDLQKTPAWPANQENPPLSPRRAIDIASKYLATLLPNGKDWRLQEVTLRPLGNNRWVYLVGFLEPIRPDATKQLSNGFQIVVLMNGTAVVTRVI